MTTLRELRELATITQTHYEQRQQAFARLVAEENRLRAEIKRLDDMRHDAEVADGDTVKLRAIGADVIWQGWLGRTKTELNIRLAQVLAVKEHHLNEVRQAYGKVLVVAEMSNNLKTATRKDRAADALTQAIDLSMWR